MREYSLTFQMDMGLLRKEYWNLPHYTWDLKASYSEMHAMDLIHIASCLAANLICLQGEFQIVSDNLRAVMYY